MGMAAHQLLVDLPQHVGDFELTGFGGDVGMEGHLHQQVAKLLRQLGRVALVDGFQGLVGLLQQVALEGLVGLLPVPRAAAGGAKPGHDVDEGLEAAELGVGKGMVVGGSCFRHESIIWSGPLLHKAASVN